jgi:nitrate reductase NapE component
VKDIERKSAIVYFLLATFFAGGLARLLSVAAVGLPNGFFVAMTVLELSIPVVAALVQLRISRGVPQLGR